MTTTHKTLRGPRGAIIACDGEPSEPLKAPPEKSRKYLPTLIDRAVFPGLQGGPHNHQTAAIAVALGEALKPEFKEYGKQIVKNCKTLAKCLMDYGFKLVTDGTDNHLVLIDLTNKGIAGKEAETLLHEAGITCNKNVIPFDSRKPYDPSGIRMGTPALTSRGMKEGEMELIAQFIQRTIDKRNDAGERLKVRKEVMELCKCFPVY
jgi:glycine hydroxymethyltransferase